MALNENSYVPILKWRRAEWGALKDLREDQKENLMPLLEIVMPKPNAELKKKDPGVITSTLIAKYEHSRIAELPEEISSSWGDRPIYIDFSLLYTPDLRVKSFSRVLPMAENMGLHLVPVINLSDGEPVKTTVYALAKKFDRGMCLRITRHDLPDEKELTSALKTVVADSGIKPEQIDLLVDLKEFSDEATYRTSYAAAQKIPVMNRWRSFIFASGAFPVDLTDCERDKDNRLARQDWLNWKMERSRITNTRTPSFADYAIRHPIHNESFQFFEPTTSIKYTLPDEWLVMKGQKRKFEQYIAHAAAFMGQEEFYGEDFSAGDKYLAEKGRYWSEYAKNPKKGGSGNTEQWIRMGINHHLAVVAHQLANRS